VAVREAASIDLYCSLGKERNPQRHGFLGNRSNPEGMLPGATLQFPLSWLYMLPPWTWEPRINWAELWLSTIWPYGEAQWPKDKHLAQRIELTMSWEFKIWILSVSGGEEQALNSGSRERPRALARQTNTREIGTEVGTVMPPTTKELWRHGWCFVIGESCTSLGAKRTCRPWDLEREEDCLFFYLLDWT
jgi:hypothetical protein